MSVIGIGAISAVAIWKTTKWLFQLPPRVFSWAMDNKIKTLLLVGAFCYGYTSVKSYLDEKRLVQKNTAPNKCIQKRKESEEAVKLSLQKGIVKTNDLTHMTFRNIPINPNVLKQSIYPKKESPQEKKEKKYQEQLTRDGFNAIQNHTLSSRPVFRPMPITGNEH